MRPKTNVLVEIDGVMTAITREMTEEEYADFLEIVAEESEEK
jgi:hypothetical protein